MKGDGWYSFPPPKPGDRAARAVHFLSVLYNGVVGIVNANGSMVARMGDEVEFDAFNLNLRSGQGVWGACGDNAVLPSLKSGGHGLLKK